MPMLFVVPTEEALAKSSCILNATKTLREISHVFESLELRFGKRVIITCVGPAVGLGDSKTGGDKAAGLGFTDDPRSAWMANCPGSMSCLSLISLIRRWAGVSDSQLATSHPTAYRLKISRIT